MRINVQLRHNGSNYRKSKQRDEEKWRAEKSEVEGDGCGTKVQGNRWESEKKVQSDVNRTLLAFLHSQRGKGDERKSWLCMRGEASRCSEKYEEEIVDVERDETCHIKKLLKDKT